MRSRPVRRGIVVLTLIGAAGLGTTSGLGLHRASSGTPANTASPTATPSPTAAPASATPSTTPSTTPARTPSATPTKTTPSSPRPRPGPAFTELALLQPEEFEARGWASAQVVQRYDRQPSPPITPCTAVGRKSDFVSAYAALYASARTNAAEVAVRFDTVGHAEDALDRMRADVAACGTSPATGVRRVEIGKKRVPPDASRVSELIWWSTREVDGGPERGVLGIARADDRVLVLNLESRVSNPAETTKIDDLLIQATRRLV